MKTETINIKTKQQKNKNAKNQRKLGLQKDLLGKFDWKTEANVKKGMAQKTKTEQHSKKHFKKGAHGKKTKRKDGILKAKTKKKKHWKKHRF